MPSNNPISKFLLIEILFSIINAIERINNVKKIDSDQKEEWNNRIVGSKDKKAIKHIELLLSILSLILE